MGVYTAGMSMGAAIALFVGSRLTDIYQGWWISFALTCVGLIAWFAVYRDHPDGEAVSKEPVGQYFKEVVKNPHVWAIGITAFLVFGMTTLNSNYMVAALTTLMGDPSMVATAGNLSTINTVVACAATLFMPVLFAKMFKNMRIPFIICLVVPAVCFAALYFIPYGPVTWVLYLIQPLFMAAAMPFTKMLPTLLPSVKPEHYGVVGGIQATLQNFGMFLVASYIISPLAIALSGVTDGLAYYQMVFVLTGVLCVIAALSLFLFPNVRSSVAGKMEDDHVQAHAATEK